jgi:hypothetical protein
MQNKLVKLTIPPGIEFAELDLSRDPSTGYVKFNPEPIKRICEASGIKIDLLMANEDNVSELLVKWYMEHIRAGGDKDDVAEELFWETVDETYSTKSPRFS